MKKNVSYNRTAIVNQGGQVSSITISRAIEIGTVDEDITTVSLELEILGLAATAPSSSPTAASPKKR